MPRRRSTVEPSGPISDSKRQTVVETLEAPLLSGLSVEDFVRFKKDREKYELEVQEKNKEDGVEITPAGYITSVDRTLLKVLFKRGYIVANSFEDITDDDIRECIGRKSVRPEDDLDLSAVESCIRHVYIKMNVPGAENRIDTLVWDYLKVLEDSGFEDFPEKCPKLAIGHIYDRIKPPLLKQMMKDEFDLQDKNHLRNKDFYVFIKELVKLGKAVEKTSRQPSTDQHQRPSYGKRKRDAVDVVKRGEGSTVKEGSSSGRQSKKQKPSCLHPDCKEHHYLC